MKAAAVRWVISPTEKCGHQVEIFDNCGRLMNIQNYGSGGSYLGGLVYLYKGNQVQIDALDPSGNLLGRTTYLLSQTCPDTITLAFRFDSQGRRLYEARVLDDETGAASRLTLWTFAPAEKSVARSVITDKSQMESILGSDFYQFFSVTQTIRNW
jgi:hypothetical protein